MNYEEVLRSMPNFLSLDISLKSTGWFEWYNGKMHFGCYGLKSTDHIDRRKEFISFLIELIGTHQYSVIYVEDVIGGENFKTNRILTELNVVIDDLMIYGKIPESPVKRYAAVQWENALYKIAVGHLKGITTKEKTAEILAMFNFKITNADIVSAPKKNSYEDVNDAFGMALSAHLFLDKESDSSTQTTNAVSKLHSDLSKCYKLTQYTSYAEMHSHILKLQKRSKNTSKPRSCHEISYNTAYKNLMKQFESVVKECGDNYIFEITAPLNKVGCLFITKNFDISEDTVYFTAVLRK